MSAMNSKVFGIGLSKTGTTSLAKALEILGYKTLDNPGIERYLAGNIDSLNKELLDTYEAITDTPIPSFYRELDQHYPNSKFILTIRDMNDWLLSCKKQFTPKLADKQNTAHNNLFMDLYQTTVFDEEKFRSGYQKFVSSVLEYFSDRQGDLLVFDVSAGHGWVELCSFLEKPLPNVQFPKANVTTIRTVRPTALYEIARRSGQQIKQIDTFIRNRRLEDSAVNTSLFWNIKYLYQKFRFRQTGNTQIPFANAKRASARQLKKDLEKLNFDIPIVIVNNDEKDGPSKAHSRNHFWLVEPLYDETPDSADHNLWSISIALIEDRIPVIGVVYACWNDVAYYTAFGHRVFKVEGTKEPIQLAQGDAMSATNSEYREAKKVKHKVGDKGHQSLKFQPYDLCDKAENERNMGFLYENTKEWDTAAAQSILTALGKNIQSQKDNKVLNYSKPYFENGDIIVE